MSDNVPLLTQEDIAHFKREGCAASAPPLQAPPLHSPHYPTPTHI